MSRYFEHEYDDDLQRPKADEAATSAWANHAQRQLAILRGVAHGLDLAVQKLESMADLQKDAGGFALPHFVREPLRRLAEAYFGVAMTSHLVDTAAERLRAADTQQELFLIEMMEGILRQVQDSMATIDLTRRWGYHAVRSEQRATEFRERLSVLRAKLLANPGSAGEDLRLIYGEVAALQQEAEMFATMDALRQAFTILDDTNGFWVGPSRRLLENLANEGRHWHKKWITVWEAWTLGRREEAKIGLAQLRGNPDLQSYLQRVQDRLQDTRLEIAISQLAVMVGVTIVTMGVGTYVSAAATGAGWGGLAVGATAVTAEAATMTALQTAIFVNDPTMKGILAEFGASLVTFGALRVFSHGLRTSKTISARAEGSRRATQIVAAGEMTGHALILGATSLAHAEIERRQKDQPSLSADEVAHIALESLAMFVVITVAGRIARKPILQPLKDAGGRLGSKIYLANHHRDTLNAFAAEAKGSRDPNVAMRLIRLERIALEAETEASRELLRRAQHDPTVLEKIATPEQTGPKISEQITAQLAQGSRQIGEMHAAEAVLSMELLGPNHYVCPRRQVPHVMRIFQENGAVPETIGRDPVTGETTYQVTEANGHRLRITEKIDNPGSQQIAEQAAKQAPPHPPVTPEQAYANNLEVAYGVAIQNTRNQQLVQLIDTAPTPETNRLILGGGFGGTSAYTTQAPTSKSAVPGADVTRIPDTLVISGPEPWGARRDALRAAGGAGAPPLGGGRVGQKLSEHSSKGLTRQPHEFNANADQLGRAGDVANALAMSGLESGMTTYPGYVAKIESNPGTGAWPSPKPLRAKLSSPTRGEFYVYTDHIDIATGLGPARSLTNKPRNIINSAGATVGKRPAQIPPAEHDALVADGRLVYYDPHYRNPRKGRVLIVGNGPTAMLNAAVALEVGAHVVVLGRPRPQAAQATQVQTETAAQKPPTTDIHNGTPQQVQARLAEIEAQLVARTFKGARTEATQDAFDHPNLTLQTGELRQIRRGDPDNPTEAGKIMVELQAGKWTAFDQTVIAIGQTPIGGSIRNNRPGPQGPPGPGQLIRKLEMILVDGRLVGLRSIRHPNIRVLGAAMSPEMAEFVIKEQRGLYKKMLSKQANAKSVPEGSRGVPGSIYQVGQNVPLANQGSMSPVSQPSRPQEQLPVGPRWSRQESCLMTKKNSL